MFKGPLLLTIICIINGLQGIYIGRPPGSWNNPFTSGTPELMKRIPMPRPSLVMRMPNIGLIIPRFVASKYNFPNYMMAMPSVNQEPILGGDYNPTLIPRSDLKSDEKSSTESITLDMMRQTAPFKKMDAFGNVVIFEGRNGERVLYRPPNDKLLVNSYYVPYYNKYLAAEYLMRVQRLRAYVNNYNYLTSNFLNGLNLYPYDDQLNYYRRKMY